MKSRRSAARLFAFLTENGIVERQIAATPAETPELAELRVRLKRHRRATDKTIERYASAMRKTPRWPAVHPRKLNDPKSTRRTSSWPDA